MASSPSPRVEPTLLCWGITYLGVLTGQVALEFREGPFLGPWSPAVAAGMAVTVGSLAALLLGSRLEPPDRRGGAWLLGIAVLAATVLAALQPAGSAPGEFWRAIPGVLAPRAWWFAVIAVAAGATLLPRLALGGDEPFVHGRLRRALGFWLAAGVPPLVALILIRPFPFGLGNWFWALLLPHGLLLGTLGVRLEEGRLNRRGARARLAGVSLLATVLLVCGGFVREMAS